MLTGFPFPSAGFSEQGVRLLRGSNVKRGEVDWSDAITVFWPKVDGEIAKYSLRAGDLVIAMDGALVGRSFATLSEADVPSLLVQRVARLRGRSVVQSLLGQLVASQSFLDHVDSVKTHTAIPHISPVDIRQFAFRIPIDEAEQHAIGAALSDVDALLTKLDQLIAKKRDLKQAAMQQLLTGRVRLQGFTVRWDDRSLASLGSLLKGRGVTRDQANSGSIACVRYGEIYTMHHDIVRAITSWISPAVAATATRLKRGDILFAGSGETKEEIGKCVAFIDDFEAYAGGDIVILRPRGVDSRFLGYALNTPEVNRQKANFGQGDAVVHISAAALGSVTVRMPPLDEQVAIGAVLADMDTELAALEARREKTRQLKQGMMQALLTGRIRLVPAPAGEAHSGC